jgi:HK97 family phage major capsid protein
MSLPNLLAATAAPWAVQPGSVPAVQALLSAARTSDAQMLAAMGDGMPRAEGRIARGVAVVPVRGFLLNRCNAFEEFFGCCSVERLSATLDALMGDEAVTAIVLSFDSPGGSVMGIEELARKILGLRDVKPIVASVDACAASAAYWLASTCSEVWVTPSGMVGSVGTIMIRADTSAADAAEGMVYNVITSGTYKGEGLPYEPMSEDERAATQALCDDYYGLFTATVAKGRGVSAGTVRAGFGEGRVVTAKDAVAQGMADKVGSVSDVLGKYAGRGVRSGMRALAAVAEVAGTRPFAAFADSLVAAIGAHRPAVRTIPLRADLATPAEDETDPAEMTQDPDETDEEFEARKKKAATAAAPGGAVEGAMAPAAAPTPTPAPQAKESAMEPTNAAPTPGAESRVESIMALATTYKKDLPWATAQIKGGHSVQAVKDALLDELRAKLDTGPDLSAGRVGPVGEPREGARPFASFGEQLNAIVKAGKGRATEGDLARLNHVSAAVSGLNEGTASDGGFAVQPDFLPGIMEPVYATGEIASRVTRIPVGPNANGVKFNVVEETTRASGSRWGGIQFNMAGEGTQGTATKPKLRQVALDLKKAIGLWYLTDELLEDSTAMESLAQKGFSTELQFFVEDLFVNGNGAGQPLGIINSLAFVSQAIEGSQTIANSAASIAANVSKMKSRFPASLYKNAVWLANQELEPTFITATLGGTSAAMPIYMPQGALSAMPYATILGRPVIYVDYCAAVGTPGDLILADLSQYATIDKNGVATATSMHLRFDYDETAFRMTYRFDGQPIWKQAVTPYKGSLTRSPFVGLATRS